MCENSDQDHPVHSHFVWMSEQVLADVWFSTWALLNYRSWEFLLWGSPDIASSLCSWSLPVCTIRLSWTANWSSKQTLVFCWPFSSCSHLWRASLFSDHMSRKVLSLIKMSDFSWWLICKANAPSSFFPAASLSFTFLWVPFNRPPAFSFRQVSCLMCIISVCLWRHIIVCSKKQESHKCHINWTNCS